MKNNPTTGRALEHSVYEFLVSKTNNNIVFEIKSYLGEDADAVTHKPNPSPVSVYVDEDEILRRRCRTRKWSV